MNALKNAWKKVGALLIGASMTFGARAQTIAYFHNDLSGTPMGATDSSGNVVWKENYRPYGHRLNNQVANIPSQCDHRNALIYKIANSSHFNRIAAGGRLLRSFCNEL